MSDEFTGDSGLKDDYDGTITTAEFEQSERGNWQLRLVVSADDGEEVPYLYSVGGKDKGWQSFDGGETIQSPSAKSRFHVNSAMQKLIDRVMAIPEASEVLRERSATTFDHRGPFHAALWLGLRFHWDVVTEKQNRPKEGTDEWEERDVQVSRPTRFLGEAKGKVSGSTGTANSTSTPASPSTNGNTSTDITEEDLKLLTRLAATNETYEEFVDAAMDATGSNGETFLKNKPVMKLVSKKDWYASVKG